MGTFSGFLPDWLQIGGWSLGCLLATAGLVQIYRERCRKTRGHNRLEPSDLIVAGGIVVFIGALLLLFGVGWSWKSAAPVAASAAPQISVAEIATKPNYPKRARDDLADAMADLSEILNKYGEEIVSRSDHISMLFGNDVVKNGPQILDELDKAIALTVELSKVIDGDNGYRRKYRTYEAEIEKVLDMPPNAPSYNAISVLQTKLNAVANATKSVQSIVDMGATPQVLGGLINSYQPTRQVLGDGRNYFSAWVGNTRQRIDQLNKNLRGD